MTKTQLFCGNLLFKGVGVYALIVFGFAIYYLIYGLMSVTEQETLGEHYFMFGLMLLIYSGLGGVVYCIGEKLTEYIAN